MAGKIFLLHSKESNKFYLTIWRGTLLYMAETAWTPIALFYFLQPSVTLFFQIRIKSNILLVKILQTS